MRWFIGYAKGRDDGGNIYKNHVTQLSGTLLEVAPNQHDSIYATIDKYKYTVKRKGVVNLAPVGDDQMFGATRHKSIWIPVMRKMRFESQDLVPDIDDILPNWEIRFLYAPHKIDDLSVSAVCQLRMRSTLYFNDS